MEGKPGLTNEMNSFMITFQFVNCQKQNRQIGGNYKIWLKEFCSVHSTLGLKGGEVGSQSIILGWVPGNPFIGSLSQECWCPVLSNRLSNIVLSGHPSAAERSSVCLGCHGGSLLLQAVRPVAPRSGASELMTPAGRGYIWPGRGRVLASHGGWRG